MELKKLPNYHNYITKKASETNRLPLLLTINKYTSFLVENFVRLYDLVRLKVIDLELISNAKHDIAKIITEQNLFMHERFFAPTIDEIYAIIKQLDTLSYNAFEESQSYDFTDMLYITYKKISNHEWEVPYWACFTNVVID